MLCHRSCPHRSGPRYDSTSLSKEFKHFMSRRGFPTRIIYLVMCKPQTKRLAAALEYPEVKQYFTAISLNW